MGRYPLLEQINSPEDLRRLDLGDLPQVCFEIREYIIDTLSSIGGHFASNLGAVELTVALHYVLETPRDRLIWDVGHQIYPHKILTGRREKLRRVRRKDGISGFPKREESPYDLYNTGHAGTSISQLLGEAMARDQLGLKHHCACVIGDASIASGMAFEALNHGGHCRTDAIVILNDNDMSISQNVGALNQYLNRLMTSPLYNRWRRFWLTFTMWLPVLGPAIQLFHKRVGKSLRDLWTPGSLFADFGFRYIGPVDGHDVVELVRVLRKIVRMKGPILVHAYTQKGKGYTFAENEPIRYHSVSIFNRDQGMARSGGSEQVGFSEIVGETLLEIFQRNRRAVAVTPAMIEGSGLRSLADRYPTRVIDVGIAEQHSVAFSGALASGGLIPYLCIYSTFLVRGLDQMVQDVGLMNLPVRIVIDRAGCVGPDGETHQGLFDIGYLLAIPNIRIFAAANGTDLKAFLLLMESDESGPLAVRFPKGSVARSELERELPDVKSIRPWISGNGTDLAILCIGTMWENGLDLERKIRNESGLLSTVVGVRWIRPLDVKSLESILESCTNFIILEDSYEHASAAAFILNSIAPALRARHLKSFLFPTQVIPHGTREEIMAEFGMDNATIAEFLRTRLRARPFAIPGDA
ncbi:MAG: 1-deoxy-D-xylulose-5-phosphate synthase [Spirochaetales bacterium]|nr:1-deoxy-D-xylulose-5-phosphate synthase [Spirochaetales bacterium]